MSTPHKHAEVIKANINRFEYKNGVLFWKDGRSKGNQIGSADSSGYLQVKLNKKSVLVHRIIWMIFNDTSPVQIDHINRNRKDNRIENLRPATNMTNQHNAGIRKDNSSGVIGVNYRNGKYIARISYNNQRINLGSFMSIEEAAIAYKNGKEIYHGATA